MLPAIERRPRRSMYASESLPPSTIATRTSCGSELIRILLVWVIAFSPARRQRPSNEDGGGERRYGCDPVPGQWPRSAALRTEGLTDSVLTAVGRDEQPGAAALVRRTQAAKPCDRESGG